MGQASQLLIKDLNIFTAIWSPKGQARIIY